MSSTTSLAPARVDFRPRLRPTQLVAQVMTQCLDSTWRMRVIRPSWPRIQGGSLKGERVPGAVSQEVFETRRGVAPCLISSRHKDAVGHSSPAGGHGG